MRVRAVIQKYFTQALEKHTLNDLTPKISKWTVRKLSPPMMFSFDMMLLRPKLESIANRNVSND